MGMIVLPYMGTAAARREQASPVPALALESTEPLNGKARAGDEIDPLADYRCV